MINYDEILNLKPFSLNRSQKTEMLTKNLAYLTKHHYNNCEIYKNMLDAIDFDEKNVKTYYDLPFIPVSLFKQLELKSVPQDEVFKVMTSSGTTGQAVSKIYLDRETASRQQKTLVGIVSEFTGSSRMPMLIIDSPSVIKNRAMFSARGAGILGFSIFGKKKTYALNDDMSLNVEAIEKFLAENKDEKIFLFGFTFMIWKHFYQELLKLNKHFDLSKGILLHGGGWKKLASEAVSHEDFKNRLTSICGLCDIHDYYGMVEQTGCIYMSCEYGHLHSSIFSDIITRRALDLKPCECGESGIVQVVSILPKSYPGHSLLTEDEGVVLGEDDCKCGRMGKYFKINGRLKNAEIRGCSDTYANKF